MDLQKLYLESTDGNISFSAMIDLDGIDFITDIINDLAGFFIISDMSIAKKRNKYSSKDILKIKNKQYDQFIVDFNIDYTWYVIRKK